MTHHLTPLKMLMLNRDLPVFPGWAGLEYLRITRLPQWAQSVGLVSNVHTQEQAEKKPLLSASGIRLYLWESPHLQNTPVAAGPATPPSSWQRRLLKELYKLLRTHGRPFDTGVQDLQFRNMSKATLQAMTDESWHVLSVIQSDSAHWFDYMPRFPVRVLVMHDVRAMMYERWAQQVPALYQRWPLLLQAWLYRRFERTYCQRYDLVITVSRSDAQWVQRYYAPTHLLTLPIPVDEQYFTPLSEVAETPAQIIFTGLMDHPPNTDAACFFAEHIFPRIQDAIPEASFWIVGRNPPQAVQALAALPGVVVTGFVPDIRPYIAQAAVVVVPLRFGSGMRNKILEAWAMEKCVVSTSLGAEGLDYQDGMNILIADDAQTMAATVIKALQMPQWREQLRSRGRELILTRHHPDQLAAAYYQAVHTIWHDKQQQNAPLHIAIDLRWMRPGVAGGIENLSRSFLNHLLHLDHWNRYTILAPAEVSYDFDLRGHDNFCVHRVEGVCHDSRRLFWHGMRFLHRRFKSDYWRSPEVETLRAAQRLQSDIVLSLSGYIYTDMYPFKNVLVVHDLQHEYHPEFFTPQVLEERTRVFGEAIRQADMLIAVSEYTRQSVIERHAVAPERIRTIYEAADPVFHPHNRRHLDTAAILRKYHLRQGDYLLFPANTWPHKNHQGLLEALAVLRTTYHLQPLLVCTGATKEAQPAIWHTIQRLGLTQQVRFLGYCPLADMPALYTGAAALVFPSLFEGFGIPLLEAMWCDCPIVCSNLSSLPEIAGKAALLVNSRDPAQLAEAMQRILTDTALRQQLVSYGQQQVQQFSWHTFTMETMRLLYQASMM